MKIFLLFFFVVVSAHAQLVHELDVSKKFPEGTSETTIKQDLLFEAALKGVSLSAEQLGFSRDQFDRSIVSRFAEHFQKFQSKKLTEKFGPNFKSTLAEKDLKEFTTALETEKPMEWRKFTRAADSISSYTFKTLAKDPSDPQLWSAQLSMVLDKRKVLGIYRKIMSSDKKAYAKIILVPEISLQHLAWSDLGLDGPASFLDPIRSSWVKWLEDNIPSNVEEIDPCAEVCMSFWESWVETKQDEVSSRVPLEFSDAIWLKLDMTLSKLQEGTIGQASGLSWNGRVVLLDSNTKRVVASFELGEEKRYFKSTDQKQLNSQLASEIYRSPLGVFLQAIRVTQEKVSLNRLSRLVIRGHGQLADAMALMELVKTRGASLGLEVHLDAFTKTEAQFVCFYKGEEKSFTDLLSGIKELKLSQSYTLVNEFTGVHHVLKLVAE